jgi:uncharacterized membrane protein (UPF0127 family)
LKTFLWAAALALAAPATPALAQTRAQQLATQPLTIATARGAQRFQVEVARTSEQQAIGLMFRKTLAADRGMVFPMQPARFASFWMKNTLIPLDLLFIRADGTVSSIAANATPLSLAPIDSIEPGAARDKAGR